MNLLLIDNYDSFTFNLAHLVGMVAGTLPVIARNDELTMEQLKVIEPDAIIISPGPGRPDLIGDFGICGRIIREVDRPILGVCLGHQGMAVHLDGRIAYADQVMHGLPSRIRHDSSGLFTGLPQDFQAIRYHSLIVSDPGPELLVTAWSDDGIVMGLRHRCRPLHGLQFHPESISSQYGRSLIRNFLMAVPNKGRRFGRGWQAVPSVPEKPVGLFQVFSRRIEQWYDPEQSYCALFSRSDVAFWLDSAAEDPARGRWSFMGDSQGPWSEQVSYRVAEQIVDVGGRREHGTLFDALARWLAERKVWRPEDLDVPFLPGWVGYLGYELKADAGAAGPHVSRLPDAGLLLADRIVAFDHQKKHVVLLALERRDESARASEWFDAITRKLDAAPPLPPLPPAEALQFYPRLDDTAYLRRIRSAREAIRRGESYEVCLTNQFVAKATVDPVPTYRRLRARNPAPFAALFRFGELAILSSSPERFLKIDSDGEVEARPIKGTIERGRDVAEDVAHAKQLHASVKDRSEHLMIVDLLRNDLGRVCDLGSIRVPDLFAIEPYATVHQMVSSVRGKLAVGVSPVTCIRAAFPGGSMTGAPKLRTMTLLDELEGGPRGIYSGAIGYIGLDGSVDLSIVIRTAVCHHGEVQVGAGGAIIDLSNPLEELAEVRLKCRALIDAIGGTLCQVEETDADPEPMPAAT